MEQIRSLEAIDIDIVADAFVEAFSDYERTRTAAEYKEMLIRRGYVPELSFGAFDNDRLVSFTLNGIGAHNGQLTAYDTGTGTIKEYRGRKLAGKIFETAVPHLQQAGVTQYLLEVLQHNIAALSVYRGLGFEVSREFNYYFQEKQKLHINMRPLPASIVFKETSLQHRAMQAMWGFAPSWQNSFSSIARTIEGFRIIGAYDDGKLIGYGAVETNAGDIAQLAVESSNRRKGIGLGLMREMLQYCDPQRVQVINVDTRYDPALQFLEHLNFPLSGKQYEMIKVL